MPPASFLIGANLPWVRYGCDFGANAWQPDGGLSCRPDLPTLQDRLRHLARTGVTAIRWFVFCDGRAGIRFDDRGRAVGLDAAVFRDLDTAVDLARTAGVQLLPVLFDFHWGRRRRIVNGVELGGRARALRNEGHARSLLEHVVEPVIARYAHEPTILGWDLFNEPEWVTFGYGRWLPWGAVPPARMRWLLAAAASLVHGRTRQLVTVGSAGAHWLGPVRGIGLDVYQPHWYDHLESRAPLSRPVSRLALDRPAWLGELPTRGSARPPREAYELARAAGYAGAWFWSVLAEDDRSDAVAAAAAIEGFSQGERTLADDHRGSNVDRT